MLAQIAGNNGLRDHITGGAFGSILNAQRFVASFYRELLLRYAQ